MIQHVRSWWRSIFAGAGPVGGRRASRRRHSRIPFAADIATRTTELLEPRLLLTFDIAFDYRYDTNGFFGSQQRRDVLDEAARIFEERITDDLTPVSPGGSNNWTAIFGHPTTGSEVRLSNLPLASDQIVVFVGSRNLTSLAVGGPGGSSASGSSAFVQSVLTRGEAGMNSNGTDDTDFGLWGGTITYSSNVTWHSDLNPPSAGQNDLLSVTLHELGHVLGFGTSDSFANLVNSSNQFVGPTAIAAFGGPVALESDGAHYASGVTSTIPGSSIEQEALLDPKLSIGSRKSVTVVDWAALDDLGWDVAESAAPVDYGDAPDASAGTAPSNYRTRLADNGPSHVISAGLKIGNLIDGDSGGLQDPFAAGDDTVDLADEDGVDASQLTLVEGATASIDVNVTNSTGTTATLYGWIDFNKDGVFSNGTESANVTVPAGTEDATVTLDFPTVPSNSAGQTFARFRLSTDAAASSSIGPAGNGEVEDHAVTILTAAAAYDPLPLFTWDAIPAAERYELVVDNLTTGEPQVIRQSHLTTNSFRPHAALAAGRYQWRFRAHNGAGFLPFSSYAYLTIFETDSRPSITDPVPASVDSLPTIAWTPVLGATRYELWVNAPNQPRIIHQTHLTQASYTPNVGLAEGDYTVWVRAFDDIGPLHGWSQPSTISIARSAVSVLTDPVASSADTTPIFGWLPTGTNDYTLRVSNVTTGDNNIIIQRGLTGTSYALPTELPPGNYAATIQAAGTSISAAVTFQILATYGQAQLISPEGDLENPLPVFNWTSVSGATRYELWVNDVSRGVSRIIHNASLQGTTFATQTPLQPGQYRAWVRAFSDTGNIGTWSVGKNFYVTEALDTPTIWAPGNSTENGSPLFAWSRVRSATHYAVSIGHGPTGGSSPLPLTQTRVTSNFLQFDTTLQPGDYVVSVTAFNGDESLGIAEHRFLVNSSAGQITVYSPTGSVDSTRPTFTWSTVDNATRYVLWLNDIGRDQNAVILDYNVPEPIYTPETALLSGEYQVWARAYNGSDPVSEWSPGVRFTITESDSAPVITAPLPNSTNSMPIITWNALTPVTVAETYEVELYDAATGQQVFAPMSGITSTSVQPTTPLFPGDYRVRVRGVNAADAPTGWSDFHAFTVEATASATLFSPLSRTSGDVLFAWSTVSTAERYELWVNDLTTGRVKFIYDANITGISYQSTAPLPTGQYRAWVRGIAADGTPSAWSDGVEFTVTADS